MRLFQKKKYIIEKGKIIGKGSLRNNLIIIEDLHVHINKYLFAGSWCENFEELKLLKHWVQKQNP